MRFHSFAMALCCLAALQAAADEGVYRSAQGIEPVGWAGNQVFAYLAPEPLDLYAESDPIGRVLVVQNLVTDEILVQAPFRTGDNTSDSILRDFGIDLSARGRQAASDGFQIGGWTYQAGVRSAGEMGSVPGPGPPGRAATLVAPEVLMIATERGGGDSWKRVHAGPVRPGRLGVITDASVVGFVVSPDNRRAAVVYQWQTRGEQAERQITVIGSNLSVGFNAGRVPLAPDQVFDQSLNARNLVVERALATHPESAEIARVAVQAALAYLNQDASGFLSQTSADLGYTTLDAPGVIPVIRHSFDFAPSPNRIRSVPSESELLQKVDAASVTMVQDVDYLTGLLEFQFPDGDPLDPALIARIDRSIVAIVDIGASPVERIFVSEVQEKYVITVVDMVVPGEA